MVEQCEAGEGETWGVVISVDGPTPFAKRECDGKRIQFLSARRMYTNVTKHSLVPKHEVVDAPPSGVDRERLPLLLTTDPIAQYYNWPLGTVVRITRHFGGHEPIPYFRVVSACCTN